MTIDNITSSFHEKVSRSIRIEPEGLRRYRVFTPFLFDDGDHFSIVLKAENGHWVLSDEGQTFMHLTYDIDEKDLQRGTRAKVIENTLDRFSVHDHEGELVLTVTDEAYGDALYSFVQAIDKISDVTYLTRERARSTFVEDVKAIIADTVPKERCVFDWHDPTHDPEGKYPVDCRINEMTEPLHVFALPGDGRVRDATIALLQFEKWHGRPVRSVGIFEDLEKVQRRVLARFTDVCEKQFSSLEINRDRIQQYLHEIIDR